MMTTYSPDELHTHDPQTRGLWEKLRRLSFDRGTGPRTFAARLAGEQGWSESFTALAIEEYRRFLLLFALDKMKQASLAGASPELSPVSVVPSAVVDKVWHLHLLYTQSYWEDLCRDILGGALHHLPADGSSGETPALEVTYEKNMEEYRRVFGQSAPESVWPRPKSLEASGKSLPTGRARPEVLATGPLVVIVSLVVFFALLLPGKAGFVVLGVIGAGLILTVVASRPATGTGGAVRRRTARRRSFFGSSADVGGASCSGGSSGSFDGETPHGGGHHHGDGSHDAGGHSHSCGGGHSCGGHGCGGHGCGGH